jgi:hypothetical protein
MIKYYSEKVRKVKEGSIITIQILKNEEWVKYWSTDERSNDYAYSESTKVASNLISTMSSVNSANKQN